MAHPRRYYVRSPDGAHVIGTMVQTYYPMLQEIIGEEMRYAGFGGWDSGRHGLDYDLIETIKKGHVALVHAFLAKGASANAKETAAARLRFCGRLARAIPMACGCCSISAPTRTPGTPKGRARWRWRGEKTGRICWKFCWPRELRTKTLRPANPRRGGAETISSFVKYSNFFHVNLMLRCSKIYLFTR